MKQSRVWLSVLLTITLSVTAAPQSQALKARYKEALDLARMKEYERAYDTAFRIVREDESYYEASVLRIALAAILKKTGSEDPKNLLRVATGFAPVGTNIERDVQNMVNQLSGTPSVTAAEPITVSPYVRRKLALVVGIGSFMDAKINPLLFAANDARVFSETLTRECRFDEVKTLIDAQATRKKILTEIDNLAKTTGADDMVVIYIASHGSPQDIDSAGVSYIVAHDSEVDNLYATSFKMEDLLNDIERRIPAQRVVAFLDTCYSGATFKETPPGWKASATRGLTIAPYGVPLEGKLRNGRGVKVNPAKPGTAAKPGTGRREQGIGRVIIASCRQNEKAWESDEIRHGYFTYYLIESLKQPIAISIEKLFNDVKAKVSEAVKREQKAEQNPAMVSSIDGPVNIFIRE